MKKSNELTERVRTWHHSWPSEFTSGNMFAGCVTIDPSESLNAWTTLSTSTWEIEVARLPALMHHALLATLKKRDGVDLVDATD